MTDLKQLIGKWWEMAECCRIAEEDVPVTWELWEALLDVAEAAKLYRDQVGFYSHAPELYRDQERSLEEALARLAEVGKT